jgi:hypothetical protein
MCSKRGLSAAVLGSLLNLTDAKYEDVQGLPTRVALMVDRSVTMRVMAEKYEWLAKTAANPAERQRFSDYAKLYREMELHRRVEKPEPVGASRERRLPNLQSGAVAMSGPDRFDHWRWHARQSPYHISGGRENERKNPRRSQPTIASILLARGVRGTVRPIPAGAVSSTGLRSPRRRPWHLSAQTVTDRQAVARIRSARIYRVSSLSAPELTSPITTTSPRRRLEPRAISSRT